MSGVNQKVRSEKEDRSNAYRAPALEKGLDILELLASQNSGLILSQIAGRLGRSVQEVYRVIISLERRGYVERKTPGDSFHLSMRLFDLASNHPPLERLLQVAQPILSRLAAKVEEVLILSAIDGLTARVIMVADNPAPIGLRIRMGTQNPLLLTASGRILIAFQPEKYRRMLLEDVAKVRRAGESDPKHLLRRVERIRKHGYELVADETLKGVTDVSFPIIDKDGFVQAAITMPFLFWVSSRRLLQHASLHLFNAASEMSAGMGGKLKKPVFPLVAQRSSK